MSKTCAAPIRRKKKRDAELVALFGTVPVMLARMVDPVNLNLSASLMDAVHDAADDLLALSGQLRDQQRFIADLPNDVRLVLCMWMLDLGLAAKLIDRVATDD